MGNMEERQKELKSKLAEMIVEAEAGDGAIKVMANANREIVAHKQCRDHATRSSRYETLVTTAKTGFYAQAFARI